VPSSDPVQRLEDILANLDRILSFTSGMDLEAFRSDEKVCHAVHHALLRYEALESDCGMSTISLIRCGEGFAGAAGGSGGRAEGFTGQRADIGRSTSLRISRRVKRPRKVAACGVLAI